MTSPNDSIRALLIEPNVVDASLIEGTLEVAREPTTQLVIVRSVDQGIEKLRTTNFDVVLVDLSENSSPIEKTLEGLRNVAPKIPCVALLAVTDESLATEALEHGAQDYLVKEGPYFALLTRAIRYAMERARAQTALQERERYYKLMIENVSDIIIVADADLTCKYVSPAIERVCQFAPSEVVGQPIDSFIHPDDMPLVSERAASRLRGEGDPETFIQIRAKHADGGWRWLQLRAKLHSEPGAEPVIVVAARDITRERHLEEALRRANDETNEHPKPLQTS